MPDNKELAVVEENTSAQSTEQSRAIAQVQASVLMAKKFPRDMNGVRQKIEDACSRISMAEKGIYSYPKGGQQVEGASIRLAELISVSMGNMDYGIIELTKTDSGTLMMSYAHDLENNVRSVKTFTVEHKRKAKGILAKISDPRDVYEHTANMGTRRLRACMLAVIPEYIQEEAVELCNKTMEDGGGVPMEDRVRNMLKAFDGINVTRDEIEQRLLKVVDAITAPELNDLVKIYNSISKGMSKKDDYFKPVDKVATTRPSSTDSE